MAEARKLYTIKIVREDGSQEHIGLGRGVEIPQKGDIITVKGNECGYKAYEVLRRGHRLLDETKRNRTATAPVIFVRPFNNTEYDWLPSHSK